MYRNPVVNDRIWVLYQGLWRWANVRTRRLTAAYFDVLRPVNGSTISFGNYITPSTHFNSWQWTMPDLAVRGPEWGEDTDLTEPLAYNVTVVAENWDAV